ncbi:MAG: deoxyribose-phosphate aldolase [Actinobacteria bacterium]|nr:deoxyribose-phosphate aldolase [Actinomycetota bacterium]
MVVKLLTREQLAKTIDQTLLRPAATVSDVQGLCISAKKNHFAAVVVNPSYVAVAKKILSGSDVKVCSVVGYPMGANTIETKVFEARDNVKKGADELDVVINLGMIKSRNFSYIEKEIGVIISVIRREQMAEYNKQINVKIVIEAGALEKEEIIEICKIVEVSGADFIKTATGFGNRGAELDDIRLIREIVTRNIGVKAAGGIKSFKDAQALIDAGATRLGTSSGLNIIDEYVELFGK